MSKRKRDPTFAPKEKMILVDVVERHFNIVECKKTDAVTIALKIKEWREIALEFNAISSIYHREWIVLKNCWENLKKRAKQQLSVRNQHFLAGTEVPPRKTVEDGSINRVLELIQSKVSGINHLDSDNTALIVSAEYSDDSNQSMSESTQNISASDTGSQSLKSGHNIDTKPTEPATTMTVDWSQYASSVVIEGRNKVLIRTPSTTTDEDSQEQPVAPDIKPPDTHHPTPSRVLQSQTQELAAKDKSHVLNKEEHDVQMRILKLKEEQEKLKLQQERIKLKILRIQLQKLKE